MVGATNEVRRESKCEQRRLHENAVTFPNSSFDISFSVILNVS